MGCYPAMLAPDRVLAGLTIYDWLYFQQVGVGWRMGVGLAG
jgi:hypothetical protein